MRYAWIAQRIDSFPVATMRRVLGVSRSGYYDSTGRPKSVRQQRTEKIEASVAKGFRPMTTKTAPSKKPMSNTLDRCFQARGPNRKWVTDITYLKMAAG